VRSVGEIRFSLAISFNASQKASSRLILVDVPSGLVNDCFRGVVGLFSSGMLKFLRARSKKPSRHETGLIFDSPSRPVPPLSPSWTDVVNEYSIVDLLILHSRRRHREESGSIPPARVTSY
jgi:hypothetical protein